jgi:hypothetical protein
MLVLDPSVSESAMAHALREQNLTALKILRLPQEYLGDRRGRERWRREEDRRGEREEKAGEGEKR